MGRRVRTGPGSRPTEKLRRLRRDPQFQACATEPGDEVYPNGIFEFNISRLIAFVSAHPERYPTEIVWLSEIPDYSVALMYSVVIRSSRRFWSASAA
jgi:hypothetical protein